MFCQNCGTEINDINQRFCHNCGQTVNMNQSVNMGRPDIGYTGPKAKNENNTSRKKVKINIHASKSVTENINHLAGGQGKVNLHLRDLVSGVLKHHNPEDAEELFICGTGKTTPKESEIMSVWPKPWLYSRVFVIMLLLYFMLTFMWKTFGNSNALMCIPIIGTFMAPFTILVFYFEMNVPRNISLVQTIKVFFIGGIASILLTLCLSQIFPDQSFSVSGAFIIAIVEELGKLLIAAYFISKHKGKCYLLNGILYGGAVGAGFAVFESIGYCYRYGLMNALDTAFSVISQVSSTSQLYYYCNQAFYAQALSIVKNRGFLSPGGHIAWAAVEGFAIVLACAGERFSWDVLARPKFLRIVWIPVALHALWDMSIFETLNIALYKNIALCVIIWIVLLVFISNGMKEVVHDQNEYLMLSDSRIGGEAYVL